MIKSLTVTNEYGETVKIVLTDDNPSHGMLIESIDGLGPAKANINTAQLATMDGTYYNSARLDQRNVVVKMKFDYISSTSVEEARLNSYKYFPIKRNVKLVVETDKRTVETIGYIESNEPDIFSDFEGAQISIICPDPYLYGEEGDSVSFFTVDSAFEFEFENASLTDNLLEFGTINESREQNIYYEGDADVGVVLHIKAIGGVGDIIIQNQKTQETMKIDTNVLEAVAGEPIKSGDEIFVSTVRGSKFATLVRDGEQINILNSLGKNIEWIRLTRGDNLLSLRIDDGFENVIFDIQYRIAYEGV